MRVLLTGARAPATLELARLCSLAGHEVHVADTARWHICRGSRRIAGVHRLPAPRRGHQAYAAALGALAARLDLDVVVPTCEEIFHLASIREEVPGLRIACDSAERLLALHDKWRFIGLCEAAGLAVPRTRLLDAGVPAAGPGAGRWVLKPRFSRFATRVQVVAGGAALPYLAGDLPSRWVAQEFLDGPVLCSWSVAQAGRLRAHVTYAVDETAGPHGAAIAFHTVHHTAVRAWVAQFVAAHALDGQFAFDFVDHAGGLRAIECNPRLTSGIHGFRGLPGVVACLLEGNAGPDDAILEPPAGQRFRSRLALSAFRRPSRAGAGLLDARDDPWPRRLQWVAWADLFLRAAIAGDDPRRYSTRDIEWNDD
ncbi:MAG: hypothetical protein IT355_03725 [Gemmatimonadaceae bacterium]|nr:hypothetical protein [Gemmatimonadaceae bacterium]